MIDFSYFKTNYQKQEVVHFSHNTSPHPVVSVIVQTYQHKDFIRACLNGILNQETDFPYEILLGEDASTDGTREICIEYAKKYPEKIRLFLHDPANKIKVLNTTTGNFNALYNLFSAKGEFIAFCEGDDIWNDPLKLQKQVNFLKIEKKFVLSYHAYQEVNYRGNNLPTPLLVQPTKDLLEEELELLIYHPHLSTVCFRNCLDKLPEEIVQVINVDSFLLSLLGHYGKGHFLRSVKNGSYRIHGEGVWTEKSKTEKLRAKIETFRHIKFFYLKQGRTSTSNFYQKRIKGMQKSLVLKYLKAGNFSLSLHIFLELIRMK